MRELAFSAVMALLFNKPLHIDSANSFFTVSGLGWAPLYLLSCAWKPWWICPRSKCSTKRPFDVDERGHVRAKFPCWFCWGRGPRLRRPGSILIGRGRK